MLTIDCIHHCSHPTESDAPTGHVYVLRGGKWYRLTRAGECHPFNNVGRWDEETWSKFREDPPCAWGGKP